VIVQAAVCLFISSLPVYPPVMRNSGAKLWTYLHAVVRLYFYVQLYALHSSLSLIPLSCCTKRFTNLAFKPFCLQSNCRYFTRKNYFTERKRALGYIHLLTLYV